MNRLIGRVVALAMAGAGWCLAGTEPNGQKVVYVDEFDLSAASCGLGKKVRPRQSVDGHPITIAGRTYARGFGTRPESAVAFATNGKVSSFDAIVGIDDDARKAGSGKSWGKPTASFFIWADGRIIWSAKDVTIGRKPIAVHVNLGGVQEVLLETRSARLWSTFDAANGDWAEARFVCEPGGRVELKDDPALFEQLGILTPPAKDEPQFNGADIWGVRPGRPVIFRIPVSGVRPMAFSAKGLPAGVTLDAAKGILGGVAPEKTGDYDIVVTARNAKGEATRTIRLAVGDKIALTPPMGWNSWNVWNFLLTGEHVMASARALHESGLGDYGWAYVNLDDFWEMNNTGNLPCRRRKEYYGGRDDLAGPTRDARGKIIPNRSFPDMKKMTDYIHSFGFKAGLYSSPGPQTCGGCEGSYQHEMQDAESWADWGFDYIKYDWCSYRQIFDKVTGLKCTSPRVRRKRHPEFERPYRLMGDCLRKQKRDIVFSFGQCGQGRTQEWGEEAGGNSWRTWEDLKDTWNWLEGAIDSVVESHRYNKPGWWVDPDMMIVGLQFSFGSIHPTYLTPNEQYTHVSIWAMIGSPLLIGCDLTKLDAFTRNLLANREVIAVSQDRLGKTAKRLRHTEGESVWARPLADGAMAVALVNRSPIAREIHVTFEELDLGNGEHWVRDLWRQRCEGKHSGGYFATVPPHATKLVYVKGVDCAKCE